MLKMIKMIGLIRRFGFRKFVKTVRHLPRYVNFYGRLFIDPRTPFAAKAIVAVTVVYLLSPLDFIPDFLPFLGEMDDLALLLMAGSRFLAMCPPHVRQEHERACGLHEPASRPATRRFFRRERELC